MNFCSLRLGKKAEKKGSAEKRTLFFPEIFPLSFLCGKSAKKPLKYNIIITYFPFFLCICLCVCVCEIVCANMRARV